MSTVDERRARLVEMKLDEELDDKLMLLLSAKTVGPEARFKLRNLLKFYAKKPHPFTACVRDNRKRFPGPGQVERICATVVDLIKGTTKWRKGGGKKSNLSDDDLNLGEPPVIDDEVVALLDSLTPKEAERLNTIFMEVVEAVST